VMFWCVSTEALLFGSPFPMTSWMSGLLGRKKHNPLDELGVTTVLSDRELRVEVRERCLPCGHVTYWVSASWYSADAHDWLDIALVHESDLERLIALLQDANAFVKEL
jgi:hypothetical protein